MRSTRSRTSPRRGNSKSQSNKNGRSKKNSKSTTTRRVKRNNTIVINLDLAKRIVQEACIAAVDSAGKDGNVKTTRLRFPVVEKEADSRCEKNTETIFADFVATTISRTIASMSADTKTLPPTPKPPPKRKRSRKRKRPLPSKVQGLEHADSLHTMCSLFPVLVSQGESSGDERNTISDIGAGELGLRTNRNESSKEYPNFPESSNERNNTTNTTGKAMVNSNHNDYDSLLPPVGASSAATTPTKSHSGAKLATRAFSHSAPKQQQQRQYLLQHSDSFIPAILGTNPENGSFQALSSPSQSRRDTESLQTKNNGDAEADEDDDDCNYERPLLGVVGDEGSGLVNRNDYFRDSHHFNNINDDTDAIIQIAKVGSVAVQKTLPMDTSSR